jgi:hypothetical protein
MKFSKELTEAYKPQKMERKESSIPENSQYAIIEII